MCNTAERIVLSQLRQKREHESSRSLQYLLAQSKAHRESHRAPMRELVLSERFEKLPLLDPLASDQTGAPAILMPSDVAPANRSGRKLTFVMIDVSAWVGNSRLGDRAGNVLVPESSKLLKSIFRGGDIISRHGDGTFLVVMPDTSEQQSEPATRRLVAAGENWNVSGKEL